MAGVRLVPHPVPTAGPPPHYRQETGSGLFQHTPGRADHLPVASHLSNPRCWKVLLLIRNPPFCHLRIGPRSAFCSYREFVQFFLRGHKGGYEATSNVLLVSTHPFPVPLSAVATRSQDCLPKESVFTEACQRSVVLTETHPELPTSVPMFPGETESRHVPNMPHSCPWLRWRDPSGKTFPLFENN